MTKKPTGPASPHEHPTAKANVKPKAAPSKATTTTKQTASPTPGSATNPSATSKNYQPPTPKGDELTSKFDVDNAVASQTQNGVTHEYKLDPEGRASETITGAKKAISHYDGPGNAIGWASEEEGKKTTRDIPGIDGTLTAIQTSTEVVLQLHDLQGNTVATIGDNTSETKLKETYNSSEFGAPTGGKAPPKYAWLGAAGVADEFASGVITEGATSYVPQTGRALQSEGVAPPGLPNGSGAGAPVTFRMEPWNFEGAARAAAEAPGLEAGREREAQEAACEANLLACPVVVEDPHWIWTLTIHQAELLASLFESGKALSFTKVGDDIKSVLGIDFLAKIEAKIEQAIAGFSQGEVEDWAYNIGAGLSICAYDAEIGLGHPNNPHCWVYVPTNNYHVGVHGPLGFIGAVFELPAFNKEAQVAYCLRGGTYCYEV